MVNIKAKFNINIYFLNNILGLFLLFFGVFDTARNYTKLPIEFGYLKDISVYLLVLINIRHLKVHSIWLVGVLIIMLLVSPFGLFYNDMYISDFIVYYLKFLEIPLMLLIFYNFNKIFSYKIKFYFKAYIVLAVLLSLINVFGYFVPNPIVSVNLANENMDPTLYKGRITVGQPAIAIFPVIFAYCYFLINSNKVKNLIISFVLFVLIFLSTSNTGIIAAILCSLIIFCLSKAKVKLNLLFLAIIVLLVFSLSYKTINQIIDISMYTDKIISIINGGSDSSMNLRFNHWQEGFKNTDNMLKMLFGNGIFGYIRNNQKIDIENTYVSTILCYGIIGFLMLVFGLILYSISIINVRKYNKKIMIFSLCTLVIFFLHFLTLDIYFCYTLYFPLGMFVFMIKDTRHNFYVRC